MSPLNLILAHSDWDYIEALGMYLRTMYESQFTITMIPQGTKLTDFLEKEKDRIDLAAVDEMFAENLREQKWDFPILTFTENNFSRTEQEKLLYRYQPAERIAATILSTAAEWVPYKCISPLVSRREKKTKVLSFYSAAGGVGNTTITVAVSMLASLAGKSVFLLNLEDYSSLSYYFPGEKKDGFARLLLYVKDQGKNLSMKIESIKNMDLESRVSYLSVPDRIPELTEDIRYELKELIMCLKRSGNYDFIVVDLPHRLDGNIKTVLEASDEILLVCTPDQVAEYKTKALLEMLSEETALYNRVNILYNKVLDESPDCQEITKKPSVKLPYVAQLVQRNKQRGRMDLNTSFSIAVHRLIECLE